MTNLITMLNELEENISNLEKFNPSVSKSTVGWQIDHSLLVLNGIASQLKKSNAKEYKWQFSLKRFLIFTTNKIPRGKARAPKAVSPDTVANEKELKERLELAKQNVLDIKLLHKNNFFYHPYFKNLNLKQTQHFLVLHTFHHLKIIREIVNSFN